MNQPYKIRVSPILNVIILTNLFPRERIVGVPLGQCVTLVCISDYGQHCDANTECANNCVSQTIAFI